MTWWANIPAAVNALPSRARSSLASAFEQKLPSTLYVISMSPTPERLLTVLSDRLEDILADNVSLAHVRIVASNFLLKEVMCCLQRLESHAAYFRSESSLTLSNSSAIWQQVTRSQSCAAFARAEQYEQHVRAIGHVSEVLHQFVGMHMEAIEGIRISLDSKRPDELARAIVASCRQASSFMHAVSQSISAADLSVQIGDAVRSSIGASPRRDISDQMHAAGQLGQFWNRSEDGSSSNHRLGSHDVNLTLQILQRELSDLRSVSWRLRKTAERGLSQPWDIQRRPLWYGGLAILTVAATRTALIHSRFLGGSGQLEDKVSSYSEVCHAFIAQSVVEPLGRFYDQIFAASPTSASEESVAVTRSSLREMLIDFTDNNLSHVEGAKELARSGSMKAVMDLIKEQARHPLRNSVTGSLGQAILLQVQKLKCDVEELMLKSKQLLRAQELNLALVALVPSLLTATALVYLISTLSLRWRSRNMEMIVSSGQTAKFLLGDVHSTLLVVESDGDVDVTSMKAVLRHVRLNGVIHVKISELEDLIQMGLIRAPQTVLLRFSKDLQILRSSSMTFESRRKRVDRMFQCYPFLQSG